MKIFIVSVASPHKNGTRILAHVGDKLQSIGTKSREKAESVAKKWDGEVYSILVDDTLRLVSKQADNIIYNEAKRIGAI